MGWFSEDDKQKHEEAYGRGVADAKNEDLLDEMFHGIGDAIGTVVPSTTEHESYEKGYHDAKRGKV